MLPQKYIDDFESSKRRKKGVHYLGISLLFLFSLIFAGPLLHEIFHAAVLELNQCLYRFRGGLSLYGFYASMQPFCSLDRASLLIFYSSGYLGTILVGAGLKISALETSNRKLSHYLASAGTGILLSIILAVRAEGDISSLLQVAGVSASWERFVVLFIVLGVFLSSLSGINLLMDLERQE